MNKFTIGDRVRVVSFTEGNNDEFYSIGAEGVVLDVENDVLYVEFDKGKYRHIIDSSWWVGLDEVELVV